MWSHSAIHCVADGCGVWRGGGGARRVIDATVASTAVTETRHNAASDAATQRITHVISSRWVSTL